MKFGRSAAGPIGLPFHWLLGPDRSARIGTPAARIEVLTARGKRVLSTKRAGSVRAGRLTTHRSDGSHEQQHES
jgi:hypothetical protein